MTEAEIFERVGTIVAETLDLDQVVLDASTTASDIEGWDSLANVQIIVAIEKQFGIRFRTGDIAAIKNVGELVARIASGISGRKPG
jgi:acyl carrier protein